MKANRPSHRAAFTLVEMLVVIVIIAILAGLLLPAVGIVRDRAVNMTIATDINNLEMAIEAYKNKYTDYPPDFSNKGVVRRHILTAWPNIDTSPGGEFDSMWGLFWVNPSNASNHSSYVDPAEAIVFWLGGFSSDPKRPFSGKGGPVVVLPGPVYAMNPDRKIGLGQFDEGRLTQAVNSTPALMSTDEVALHGQAESEADIYPVYMVKGRKTPFVYFDQRTYGGKTLDRTVRPPRPPIPPPHYPPAAYTSTLVRGLAVPYRSDRPGTPDPSELNPMAFDWVNKSTFQIISAGIDDNFGSGNVKKQYPSGLLYLSPGVGDDDNITNFSEGNKLGDQKP